MKLHEFTVFVRIGLYIAIGRLVAGGWLPPDIEAQVTNPQAIEAMATAILGLLVGLWYWLSTARKALKERAS